MTTFFKKQNNLFKKGELSFFTPILGTTDLAPANIKSRIALSNAPERLKTFFFGNEVLKLIVNNHKILYLNPDQTLFNKYSRLKKKNETYFISIKRPTSGYSETALMSVAGTLSQITGRSKTNDLIYDYPINIQKTYWETTLKIIINYLKLTGKKSVDKKFWNLKPIIMGHHGRELSNSPPLNRPGIRSVILHHDHLVFINENQIVPVDWDENIFGLKKESYIYWGGKEPFLPNFVKSINSDKRIKELNIKFIPRKYKPYGYETTVIFDHLHINSFTNILYKHFLAYSSMVGKDKLLLKSKLIQPAFTFYLIPFNQKVAKIIFSPNIVAGSKNKISAGGPERAGLLIHRRPDIQAIYKIPEKERFWKLISK